MYIHIVFIVIPLHTQPLPTHTNITSYTVPILLLCLFVLSVFLLCGSFLFIKTIHGEEYGFKLDLGNFSFLLSQEKLSSLC